MVQSKLSEPKDVLYRIKRGLSGYVSYLAACEMNESFSEYVLYEPILRILTGQGYTVKCEVECPGIEQPLQGDKKRLDFVATKADITFAMEVKWVKKTKPNIIQDMLKLKACQKEKDNWHTYLCFFGTKSCISKVAIPQKDLKERGEKVIAEFGRTKYGCRIFETI